MNDKVTDTVCFEMVLKQRDEARHRIKQLETAMREIEILEVDPRCSGQMWVETLKEIARKALESP